MTALRAVLLASVRLPRLSRFVSLLPWEGGTLFEHQLNVLENGPAKEIIAVLGYRACDLLPLAVLRSKVRKVIDPRYEKGYGSGLRVGLQALGIITDPVLLLPVEYPVDGSFVEELADAAAAEIADGAGAVVPSGGLRRLAPVIIAPETARRLSNRQAFAESLQDTLRRLDGVREVQLTLGEGGPAIHSSADYRTAVGVTVHL